MPRKPREHPESPEGKLQLEPATTAEILARLRRVEGQVRAVHRMIEQGRDCHAIAHQMGAAKAALERATIQLMTASMAQCLRPGKSGAIDQTEMNRLTDTFIKILS
ncbi:MAG: metal-sensitive transcriptional regulator [bacterium]|nr:metal-sensitive transcriptional regulator [bacterium]